MGDCRKCQTSTASPAKPGGLPVMLDYPANRSRFLILRGNHASACCILGCVANAKLAKLAFNNSVRSFPRD